MVRKPVIYDAVQKVDKHLRKEVKKREKTVEEATVAMNKVLDTANCVLGGGYNITKIKHLGQHGFVPLRPQVATRKLRFAFRTPILPEAKF